jgi:SOS response regulatory protein OraA/RecX
MTNSQFQSLSEAYNSIYESDLGDKILDYTNASDYDEDDAPRAAKVYAKIEKKYGPKAAEHAERSAAARNFGRNDASGKLKGLAKPRIEKSSWRTTKAGKMNKNDQATLKRKLQARRNQNEEFDIILDYLLDEGFVNNEVSAEVFIEHMSDEWLNSILEGYKKLPVGKMINKAAKIAAAGETPAGRIDTRRAAKKRTTMIAYVADKHDPEKVKQKNDHNRAKHARKVWEKQPRRNELQDNW